MRIANAIDSTRLHFKLQSIKLDPSTLSRTTTYFFVLSNSDPCLCGAGGWVRYATPARRANRSVPTAPWCRTHNTAQTNDKRITRPRRDPCARRSSGPIAAAPTLSVLACSSPPGEEESVPHAPRPSTPLSVTRLSAPRREPVSPSLRCCAPSGRSRPWAVPVRCLRRIPVQRAARAPGLRF